MVIRLDAVTVIINEPPYGSEKPWNALRLASALALDKFRCKVNIFLMGDAVSAAKRGQSTPEGYYNLGKMLGMLLKRGVEIKVCGACINARGLKEEGLVEGVERGSMMGLAEWVMQSQKIITF